MRIKIISYYTLIFSTIGLLFSNLIVAQDINNNIKNYRQFNIPLKILKGYQPTILNRELLSLGLSQNPGISTHQYLKSLSCIDCYNEHIIEVYFENHQLKEDVETDIGIVVKKYSSTDLLQNDLQKLKQSDNTIYFTKDEYLILFWSNIEDENLQLEHFDIVTKHFQSRGISPLKKEALIVSEFGSEDLSDSTYTKNIQVKKSETRQLQYLFSSEGGMIAFYNDGTVSLCGDCLVCDENVDKLALIKPFSIYHVNNGKIMIYAPDVDVKEPLILELHDNTEAKEWYIQDYKKLIDLPQACQ